MVVNKGKLKMALAAEKGTSWQRITEKHRHKAKLRAKAKSRLSDSDNEDDAPAQPQGQLVEQTQKKNDDDWEGVDSDEEEGGVNIDVLNESDSDSEVEMEEKIPRKSKPKPQSKPEPFNDDSEGAENDEDNEDIPLSDLEDLPEEEREDMIPHQRLTINNTRALLASLKRIQIARDSTVTFASHMTVVAPGGPTAEMIEDVQDDIKRELGFFAQAQSAAREGRRLLRKESVPFTRPGDYFAEMVKDDGHMEKVKAKLVEEATNKKAAAEARKLRDLKKFGKQVQVAKLQERAKEKRETLEKIKSLKKKRSETNGAGLGAKEADLFDIGIEQELSKPGKRGAPGGDKQEPNRKRQKKNEKFGFGGKKRLSKSGDAMSSGDLSGFGQRRTKGKSAGGAAKRPGKARRKAIGGKR